MAFSGLGAAVGRAVAPHHLRRAVPEQVLAIELACVVRDGSGGERVAEAVGVEPSYAGGGTILRGRRTLRRPRKGLFSV